MRVIGFENAVDLVRGGPQAATTMLRGELGGRLIDGLTGTNVGAIAQGLAGNVDDAIWTEIGYEEAAIRANPEETRDPLLIGVFGAGAAN